MSKELDAALVDVINSTKDGIKAGVSFLQQQIPDVIQQLLIWKLYEAIFICVILGVFLILVGYLNYKQYKWLKTVDWEDHPLLILNGIQLLLIVPSSMFISELKTIIQIYFAPKIFLIEYAATLVK